MAKLGDDKVIVLDKIPFEFDIEVILKQMKIHGDAQTLRNTNSRIDRGRAAGGKTQSPYQSGLRRS